MRYRPQMNAITRAGAVEVANEGEERVVERLHDIAATVGMWLSQEEYDGRKVVEATGGTLYGAHMDGGKIREYFGRGVEVLALIAREGVSAEVQTEGDLEKEKLRVIHDITFGGGATVRNGEGSKEPGEAKATGGISVKADMDWHKVPECRLAGVTTKIIRRILGLRGKIRTGKGLLLQKMDVKSVFRQVGITLNRATAFAYRLGDLIIVDLRLQF